MNKISLFLNGKMFKEIKSPANITKDFAQMKLALKYELGCTAEDVLTCEITNKGERKSFQLDYENIKLKLLK